MAVDPTGASAVLGGCVRFPEAVASSCCGGPLGFPRRSLQLPEAVLDFPRRDRASRGVHTWGSAK